MLAAGLLASDGLSVGVVHSDPALSGNRESWESASSMLAEAIPALSGLPGFRTLHVHDFVLPLGGLREIRGQLGFRSCLHTAEKLLNPWTGSPLIRGISHRHYA
jgi:anthranilate phosphoribosyltransferase